MSPSHSRHSAPALSDDDIVSVFLRIPPDEPARLVRASLTCKAWRRILTGPDFCRLYREFHGTPPMLGFVIKICSWNSDDVFRFVPTTAFRHPGIDAYPSHWKAVDSRHGRILVEPAAGEHGLLSTGYIVWDPITNGQWGVPFPSMVCQSWTGAVLCAKEHCDHLGCHGPPFFVAMVGSCQGTTYACVYASESDLWSDIITLGLPDYLGKPERSILVGNTVIHSTFPLTTVPEFSSISWPSRNYVSSICRQQTGVSALCSYLRKTACWCLPNCGVLGSACGQLRMVGVIELEKLLPPRAFERNPCGYGRYGSKPNVCGFAEGVVFLSTMAGLYTVELNSGRTKKVDKVKMASNVTPWLSFYTQDQARRVMPQP